VRLDTKSFLDAVLPEQGRRCIGALRGGVFQNIFRADNAAAEAMALKVDAAGKDAYIALAGFGEDNKRTQANVVALRTLWLDIDTQENKPKETYASRKEAAAALTRFCKELGLPKPWIVSSGYGLHVYFPFDEDVPPATWAIVSKSLKAAVDKWGLAVDPSRTTDSASVLRMPGTANRKSGGAKQVKILQAGEATDVATLLHLLSQYAGADLLGPPPARLNVAINSDLINAREFEPSDPDKVANHCAQLAAMRETRGNLSQPLWYACIGVVAHCEGGEDTSKEWSIGHPAYSDAETEAKVAQALKFGPTTCEKLQSIEPGGCSGCPHKGKITSPIRLGTTSGEPQYLPAEPVAPAAPGEPVAPQVWSAMTYPQGWGFGEIDGWARPMLWRAGDTDEDTGKQERIPVSDVNFYPVARIDRGVGYSMHLRMHGAQGSREFTIQNGLVGEGGAKLSRELAENEVVMTHPKHAGDYLGAWIRKLRDEYDATPSSQQFGWFDRSFIIGTRRIIPGQGTLGKAIIHSNATSEAKALSARGDLATWVETVDTIYNRPDSEPLQYCILASFAAPLYRMLGESGGVTVYAHSSGSGYGKTTAQKVGLSAWGNAQELILMNSQFTETALWEHMGTMNNLPVVIDEMTNCTPAFASTLVYSMSTGKSKARRNADLSKRDSKDWATICMASGNKLLTEKISAQRTNAEAEMMRVFEFTLHKKGQLDPNTAMSLVGTFNDHYGHGGESFMRYVVDNYDSVRDRLIAVRKMLNKALGFRQEERYWSALHACVLVALELCRKLDLLRFSTQDLLTWIKSETLLNRGGLAASVRDPLAVFNDMLSDIWRGVLVTYGEGSLLLGEPAMVVNNQYPIGTLVGRHILPVDTNCREVLYISKTVAKNWCDNNGASLKEMKDALVAAGWLKPQEVRFTLGKGVPKYSGTGNPLCWEINRPAMRADTGADDPIAQKLSLVKGGSHDKTQTAGM